MSDSQRPAINQLTDPGGAKTPSDVEGEPEAPTTEHLAGVPDSLPPQWCGKCKADVIPRGKSLCPRCGRMLKQSFLARKHPVNILRRDALRKKLTDEYRPTTQRLQSMCEQYAGVLEQLEVLKAGSQEHKRLVELGQLLGDALEAARPAEAADASVENMTPEQLEAYALDLAQMARNMRLPPMSAPGADRWPPVPDGQPQERPESLEGDSLAPPEINVPRADQRAGQSPEPALLEPRASLEPAPAPRCPFCHQAFAKCAEIREQRLDDWRVLHYDDPAEQQRRAELATKEMFESLRRERQGGWR